MVAGHTAESSRREGSRRRRVSRTAPLRIGAPVLAACLAAAACGGGERDRAAGDPPPSRLDELVTWGGEIRLEESDEVINVFPNVTATGDAFLVADAREVQFRVYGKDGRLASHFGQKGEGPEEFRSPVAALRRASGNVLVVDINGKVAEFTPAGELRSTGIVPFAMVYDADLVNDTLMVIAGRAPGSRDTPLLHLVDPRSGAILHSFFRPAIPPKLRDEYMIAGFVDAAVRGDTVAAVFALSDTVYLFSPTGEARGKIPIPARSLRPLKEPVPRGAPREKLQEWVSTFSSVSNVHWGPDGTFLVQYFDIEGVTQHWRLVRMDRGGKALFEGIDTPQLLATGDGGATLYFVKPDSETPNVWSVAHLQR